jgi:hypothetical protein
MSDERAVSRPGSAQSLPEAILFGENFHDVWRLVLPAANDWQRLRVLLEGCHAEICCFVSRGCFFCGLCVATQKSATGFAGMARPSYDAAELERTQPQRHGQTICAVSSPGSDDAKIRRSRKPTAFGFASRHYTGIFCKKLRDSGGVAGSHIEVYALTVCPERWSD